MIEIYNYLDYLYKNWIFIYYNFFDGSLLKAKLKFLFRE